MVIMEHYKEVICALSNGDIFNDLEDPEPGFKVTAFLKSNILGTKLL